MTKKTRSANADIDEGQTFVSHLLELRDRLLRIVLAVLVIFLGLVYWANDIYTYFAVPLLKSLPEGGQMIAVGVASPFFIPFKLTLFVSLFLVMPYVLYQIWAFIAPGLYSHERRLAAPLVVASSALFYAGMAFAYFVVFPLVFKFLTSTTPEGVQHAPDIAEYLNFVLTIFFAFGIAFQVPVATILMVWTGATTPAKLVKMRPYIIVGAFVIGMVLTPPDAISQTLLAVPMWMLFELGVVLSRFYIRKAEEAEEDEDDNEPPSGERAAAPAAASGYGGEQEDQSSSGDYTPMSDEEMDAELDRLDQEFDESDRDDGERGTGGDGDEDEDPQRRGPDKDRD